MEIVKRTLSQAFPERKIYTAKECLDALGWTYEHDDKTDRFTNIQCCGETVTIAGWFGSESAYCKKCHKGMQDLLGILPASSVTVGMIDTDKYDFADGRHWIAENIWGY
jgi:hypothetical protein